MPNVGVMYDVAVSVAACVRSGTRAEVAWVIDRGTLPAAQDVNEALVLTPGGGRMGALLGGALDDQVAAMVAGGATRRVVEVTLDQVGALIAGLPSGGTLRVLVLSATDLPPGFWNRAYAGEPLTVVAGLSGDEVTTVEAYAESQVAALGEEIARRVGLGVTSSFLESDRAVTAWWPVPRLALVGGGPICDAVEVAAGPLGWRVSRFATPAEASPELIGYGPLDKVLVSLHDLAPAGRALATALSSGAGYIGALGSVEMNRRRLDWLSSRGTEGLDRIHSPAGLDIGARRPAEVAVAIVAEALATRVGTRGSVVA